MWLKFNEVILKFNSHLWLIDANSVGTDMGLLEISGPSPYRHGLMLRSMEHQCMCGQLLSQGKMLQTREAAVTQAVPAVKVCEFDGDPLMSSLCTT